MEEGDDDDDDADGDVRVGVKTGEGNVEGELQAFRDCEGENVSSSSSSLL